MHQSSEFQARGVEGLKNHPKAGDIVLRSPARERVGSPARLRVFKILCQ